MNDDVDFLTAMYGQHDDEDRDNRERLGAPLPERGIISLPALSQIVRSQAQMITRLNHALANSDRQIRRLESRIRTLHQHVNTMGRSVNSLDQEMNNKLDRRDW